LKLGNYTNLAKDYEKYRPSYAKKIIQILLNKKLKSKHFLEIGAGTGKFTELLLKVSQNIEALEPNKPMLHEFKKKFKIKVHNSKAEKFDFKKNTYDVIVFASCFHWIDFKTIYHKIKRSLKLNGYLLIIYNTRDLKYGKFIQNVEKKIKLLNEDYINLRKSSGGSKNVNEKIKKFLKMTNFKIVKKGKLIHYETFSKQRYVGAWNSSNEIRARLGKGKYFKFITWVKGNFPNKSIKAKYLNNYWLLKASK